MLEITRNPQEVSRFNSAMAHYYNNLFKLENLNKTTKRVLIDGR
jgi:hypothetical protein